MEKFFEFPRKQFLIRELSRQTGLAQTAVRAHLKALLKEDLVIKEKTGTYPSFRAARENKNFKQMKAQNLVIKLQKCGLIEHLEKTIYPACIVLFGSSSRGEDNEQSDIDLFVQAKQRNFEVKKFEKLLRRKISLLFEADTKALSTELLNNIANGIILYGFLKVA